MKYTEYPNGGHECLQALTDTQLLPWLVAHKSEAAAPDFTPAQMTNDVAFIIKTLPDGMRGTWTGKAERGEGVSRVLIENVRYRMKPAKDADQQVADMLAKIAKGEITGTYTVTGVIELTEFAGLTVEKIEFEK